MNPKDSKPVWPSRPAGEGQSLFCDQLEHANNLQPTGQAKKDGLNVSMIQAARQESRVTFHENADPVREALGGASSQRRAIVDALVREAMKSYSGAVRNITRRGFGDIAKDAVQETLLLLVRRATKPAFVVPVVMRAWLYRWSVCSAFVLRRHGGRIDHVTFDEEVEAYARQQIEFAEADAAASPDHELLSEVEERAITDWHERTRNAQGELLARDRETFDAEVARRDRGEAASPLHRKHLERARMRARPIFARWRITSAVPPDDLPPAATPAEP